MEENNNKAVDFTDLSTEILKGGNSIRFKAHGSSMLPWIKDGDMLTIRPLAANELRVGQVVFYASPGERPIVHRIIRIQRTDSETTILTRGDASPKSEEKIEADKALGSVVQIHRGSTVIQVDRNLWWRLVRMWPRFTHLTYLLVRFQRRFRRYVILSPKDTDR